MPNDNPLDSEETLRIMTTLAELADMYQPNTGDVREAMEQARHRLAILQQFANGQGPLWAVLVAAWGCDDMDCGDDYVVPHDQYQRLKDAIDSLPVDVINRLHAAYMRVRR